MLDTKVVNELLILGVLRTQARHGYEIGLEVERQSGGRFVFQYGTLYPILHRLEAEGSIQGQWESGEGRRRKVYGLTGTGRTRLRDEARQLRADFEATLGILEGRADESLSDAS